MARNGGLDNDPEQTILGPGVMLTGNKLFGMISVSTQASTGLGKAKINDNDDSTYWESAAGQPRNFHPILPTWQSRYPKLQRFNYS